MIAIAAGASCGLLAAATLLAVRALAGPSLHDRLLAAQGLMLVVCLIAASVAAGFGEAALLDAALAFLFVSFIAAIIGLKFLRRRSLQTPLVGGKGGA